MNALRLVGALTIGLVVAGCGGPPDNNPLLDEARTEVRAAGSERAVVEQASNALDKAEQALRRGELLLEQEAPVDEVYHQAYLARQYVAIARETAKLRTAEAEIRRAESERQQVISQARERDAERSQREAERSQREAETERRRAEAALDRARELEEELEAQRTERGLVLTLSEVLFDVGHATLKEGAGRTIRQLVDFLRENPERRVLVEGHTDNTGSYQLNQDLSRRRAEAVKRAIVDAGIPGDRIRTVGHGPDYPVASNNTAAGRQQNRRVEIIISDREGQIPDR